MRRSTHKLNRTLSILISIFLLTIAGLLLGSTQRSKAQSLPVLTVTDPAGHVLTSETVYYLGHNVIGGSWHSATLQGIYQGQSPDLFESPRHRLAHYVVPDKSAPDPILASRSEAVGFALCNGQWQPSQSAGAGCLPFDLTSLITVQSGTGSPIHVRRLLYADQTANVALWELVDSVNWQSVPLANTIGNALTFGGGWVNDLYGQVLDRTDTPLPAILKEAHLTPTIGGNSIGDPTAPELGNTGYSVTHYDLALNFNIEQATLDGVATLTIRTTYPQLSRFSLDFSVLTANKVTLDGQTITFEQDSARHKLFIVPASPLAYGQVIKLQVTYGGNLKTFDSRYIQFLPVGMFVDPTAKRVFDVDEPDGANSWFPCNDHPLNRATFTFHITVESGLYAAANGTLQGDPVQNADGTRTFTWNMPQPMATYLAVVAIANYDPRPLADSQGHIPLTVYAYAEDADAAQKTFQITDALMKLEVARFGPFPFDSYGQVLVPQNSVGMESQTMTVLPDSFAEPDSIQAIWSFVGHEMAHQWYGDSVGLSSWGEIWLNEGFASYAEYLDWQDGGYTTQAAKLVTRWKSNLLGFAVNEPLRSVQPSDMFGINSYLKGGYLLYMLREQIGDQAFFQTLQTYAQRFKFKNATSDDFWTVAEEVSGKDLSQFFTQWLIYSDIPHLIIIWTEHNASNGSSQVDALVCQTTHAPYTLDIPVNLTAGSGSSSGAPVTTSTSTPHLETLHLTGEQTVVHWTEPFSVDSWQVDPQNTTLVSSVVRNVSDTLPATCPSS